ncbi:uncharacterized protein TRIADDRAFT_29280 [Trichoplax adhaerens]|uniref:NADP-dependent oxidoreductase domain-containing protein n=2 Tax=Trichoplax adhaerens TaxID=10228 RepID=B3S4W9_TRIAD|nr:hypothetical protein TRIADDRAFT_29280 [Trichoplax adhaerens]EDV22165.1 hypothetical protein TRIADDRAFT_29280 [Trichoplax adhaerens]|eukprot:XP_002115320.1 hypothetical protein TRIADDRAFT_29280 [Trichoplax adhaerens]
MSLQQSITLSSGYQMPLLGLGTWKSSDDEVGNAVKAALDCGYRHIDCAMCYDNEESVGKALSEKIGTSVQRDELFITSKLWNTMHAPKDVKIAVEKTLKDLQLDYLDLYLIHYPQGLANLGLTNWEPTNPDGSYIYSDVHYNDTWKAMEELVDEGKVKSIGVSNFNSKQIDDVLANCRIKPVINQIEIHPYFTQSPLVDHCLSRGISVTAFSPLGSFDRPQKKENEPVPLEDATIKAIAKKYGKTPAQVMIRFAIERGLTVIPKSKSAARIKENAQVFDFSLTPEDMDSIYSLNRNWRSCSFTVVINGVEYPEYHDHPLYPFYEPY